MAVLFPQICDISVGRSSRRNSTAEKARQHTSWGLLLLKKTEASRVPLLFALQVANVSRLFPPLPLIPLDRRAAAFGARTLDARRLPPVSSGTWARAARAARTSHQAARSPALDAMEARLAAVRSKYEAEGQGHVLNHYASLNAEEQGALLAQLEGIDVARVLSTYKLSQDEAKESAKERVEPLDSVIKLHKCSGEDKAKWEEAGLGAIKEGKCAFLLLAGGQGTRLGTPDPKGCYDIGLPSSSSLFELMAARLSSLRALAGEAAPSIPWYVMTSPMTDGATKKFFEQKDYFGLKKEDVVFFEQGTLPCLSIAGNILMEAKGRVATAPDGNGGIYRALAESGSLDDMDQRGVEVVHCSSVDNALVLPCDPLFVGYSLSIGADCGAKVCGKARATEAVGVICKAKGGQGARVVEYSEIDEAVSAEVASNTGELRLNAGNICNHIYTTGFLGKAAKLPTPYHIAKKKIGCIDAEGVFAAPAANNGVKLEQFIFDCFPHSEVFACAEVLREEEFGPVKNAPGAATDSPDTARALLLSLGQKYVEAAGGKVEGEGGVEVSARMSYKGEGLAGAVQGKAFPGKSLIAN